MKIKIINLVILLVVIAGTLLAISAMPDTVPVHFNIHGAVDRWGSKYELLIMCPILAAMQALWIAFDAYYRKRCETAVEEKDRVEAKTNRKVLEVTFTSVSVLFAIINGVTLYMSYSQLEGGKSAVDPFKIITVVMGIAFIVMGNYMPKAKKNLLVGFRLPWTRYNDVTWQKTNRASGIAMVVFGIIIALGGLIFKGLVSMIIMLSSVVVFITALTIYAYGVYKSEKAKD